MNKLDITELTVDQINYIKSQQTRADAEVSDPSSTYYEPGCSKRHTAARILMRKWEKERGAQTSPSPPDPSTPIKY